MKVDWSIPVVNMVKAFFNHGFNVLTHNKFKYSGFDGVGQYRFDIHGHDIDICIYNHTDISQIVGDVVKAKKNLFFKPTVPERGYTTLDPLGYGPYSSITYEKPAFDIFNEEEVNNFYSTEVKRWINLRPNKWYKLFNPVEQTIEEDDYYLIAGQCYGDEVVKRHDFGSYKEKVENVVRELARVDPSRDIIVKLHPYVNGSDEPMTGGFGEYIKNELEKLSPLVKVYTGNLSIHDFLPKARCVFLANTGAGFEAMMHNKPIVSWGNPEYHWVTYRLLHLADIIRAINIDTWFNKFKQQQFLYWYTKHYCFYDDESCYRRVGQLI
jgi:hypothetical protein